MKKPCEMCGCAVEKKHRGITLCAECRERRYRERRERQRYGVVAYYKPTAAERKVLEAVEPNPAIKMTCELLRCVI